MSDKTIWDSLANLFHRLQRWAKEKASARRLEYMDPPNTQE